MKLIAKILTAFVAIEHLFILYIEMFAWKTMGKKVFEGVLPVELFDATKIMAANQGLYNGFLAAGLIWSFLISDKKWQKNIAVFFLLCVAVAGVYGSLTASPKILFTQATPAILALIFVLISKSK